MFLCGALHTAQAALPPVGAGLPCTKKLALSTGGAFYLHEQTGNLLISPGGGCGCNYFPDLLFIKVSVSIPSLYCKTLGDFKCHEVEILCNRKKPKTVRKIDGQFCANTKITRRLIDLST